VSGEAWVELVFMMVILKLPIVYLILVVWWAIRAVPDPPALEGAALPVPHAWSPRAGRRDPRGRRPGPRGGPVRTYARRVAAPGARARR
jgi:hypothetical protein